MLGAAILVGGAEVAGAQGGRGRAGAQMNGIELTDAQKVKLEEIQKKYQPEMLALRDQMMNGGDRTDLAKKGIALQERSAADIREILTSDQQAVFDKNMSELKARRENRQAPPER
jgi:Spy/CpxP family protein refolding chaperone